MKPIRLFTFLLLSFSNFSIAQAQIITTVAGDGTSSFFVSDGGQATATHLNGVAGIRIDTAGNIYFAEVESHRIRKIDAGGIIHTVAGSGGSGITGGGYSGDSGPATDAKLKEPNDVTFDDAGNMYIADNSNNCIRKVDLSGIITTIAGSGYASGYSGDGMQATASLLYRPTGVTTYGTDNLYISDCYNYRIRKVDGSGLISTIAGNGSFGYSGDNGPATLAKISYPNGITTDEAGNIYFSDRNNFVIRKIDTSGTITTIAGTGIAGTGAEDVPATSSALMYPTFIAYRSGNLYFSDYGNNRIRKINAAGVISTIAGDGVGGYYGDDSCAAIYAALHFPIGLAVDNIGSIYIGDYGNARIRKTKADHPPFFTAGHVQYDTICSTDTVLNLNTALTASDIDPGQTITWAPAMTPMHGTLTASYTATSTGGVISPAGMTYSPAAGYIGNDTFRVSVNDCAFGNDTTLIVATIVNCAMGNHSLLNKQEELHVWPSPNYGLFSLRLSGSRGGEVHVIVTNVTGIHVAEMETFINNTVNVKLEGQGIYFILAATAAGMYYSKVVVQ